MPKRQGCKIEEVVTRFFPYFEKTIEGGLEKGIGPDSISELESAVYDVTRRLGDALMAELFRLLLHVGNLDRLAVRAFMESSDGQYRDEGQREVKVHFAGGSVFSFLVTYLRPVKKKRRGRPRGRGRRGKAGKGVFPVLELLGVHCVHSKMKATALFEDRLIRAITASDSHEAGRQLLESWGIAMNSERLQNFFERAGADFREQRDQWLSMKTRMKKT